MLSSWTKKRIHVIYVVSTPNSALTAITLVTNYDYSTPPALLPAPSREKQNISRLTPTTPADLLFPVVITSRGPSVWSYYVNIRLPRRIFPHPCPVSHGNVSSQGGGGEWSGVYLRRTLHIMNYICTFSDRLLTIADVLLEAVLGLSSDLVVVLAFD